MVGITWSEKHGQVKTWSEKHGRKKHGRVKTWSEKHGRKKHGRNNVVGKNGSIPFWRQIKFGAVSFGAVFIDLKIPHAPRGAPVFAPREGPDLP